MQEPFFVDADEVVALNHVYVNETGEPHQVRDPGLLHSALAVPKNRFHYEGRAIDQLGLDLAVAIARNHPFTQGNKRTGWGAMLLFWELNGWELVNEDHAYYADLFVGVITGEVAEEALLAQMHLLEI
ncbi:type II toxin-antitoxin system death-on-curing family toxin [Ancylobacter sp. FA202]|uniref:type II toxin-antitoxin system death-on-curing family toxin n=1 Tax=Ancylobacter sp. FA202 TaxID=1111106 RepID=UPI0003668BE5|nr:type II toxin-antitoxin system death-on-curing family toxin [Ancylobacter sp. FA202]